LTNYAEGLVWQCSSVASGSARRKSKTGPRGPFFYVRPAWAHSYGCKSHHKLVTVGQLAADPWQSHESHSVDRVATNAVVKVPAPEKPKGFVIARNSSSSDVDGATPIFQNEPKNGLAII
jgi:hypothetical protein